MNTLSTVPTTGAYIVQVSYPAQPSRNKSFTFRDAVLLSARRAAFYKVQQVVAEKSIHDAVDITIDLVEIDRSSTSDKHPIIVTIYRQRLNRTSFISSGGEDLLLEMGRKSLVARSLPDSIFLTIGLERSNEDGNSLEVIEKTLTTDELAYYQQGY